MNIALWIVAGLMAAIYLLSGFGKLLVPRERMAAMGDASRWVLDFRPSTLKVIGALEILGAVGLILPALLDTAPILVPLVDATYLALTAFVAIGRFAWAPFTG
ncbi:DoxX family protein [Nocardioides sp. NBC_00850]|uniref:DoxX family protein n=1 Tax=Nocardioides sp. NBC_00850 TaxID=2976001 RepID=UPI00386A1C2D|nr:DoxX family protein [Nocardioides sp. NBC_00850]